MGTRKERRRERTRMRNDGKERDTKGPRESLDRELKIGEWGKGYLLRPFHLLLSFF